MKNLPPPLPTFRLLSLLGILGLWGSMALNGSLRELFATSSRGTFPSGALLHRTLTGIPSVDFWAGFIIAFFSSLIYHDDLPDLAPYVHAWNLITVLAVVNHMALVEDRRSGKTGPLRG